MHSVPMHPFLVADLTISVHGFFVNNSRLAVSRLTRLHFAALMPLAQTDVLLRVTSTAICGSDLHLYLRGVPGLKSGDVLGHEFMGVVDEVSGRPLLLW